MIIRRLLIAVVGSLMAMGPAPAPAQDRARMIGEVPRLVAAYPDFLSHIDGNALVWKDGVRMRIDDNVGDKAPEARLSNPDIKDMFHDLYPTNGSSLPPARDFDPGRVRYAPLFDRMYGDCRKKEVEHNLVTIPWLPKKWGRPVRITKINGVSERLAAISRDLDQLPYLFPHDGTYNCRPIAGTDRVSAHGHGIAIDLAAKLADYWRWSAKAEADAGAAIPYRNRFPMEIVEIFERHGFIWGGRWYHYDTMHFEYRPELLGR
jgi:hypothetical protein